MQRSYQFISPSTCADISIKRMVCQYLNILLFIKNERYRLFFFALSLFQVSTYQIALLLNLVTSCKNVIHFVYVAQLWRTLHYRKLVHWHFQDIQCRMSLHRYMIKNLQALPDRAEASISWWQLLQTYDIYYREYFSPVCKAFSETFIRRMTYLRVFRSVLLNSGIW